MVERPQGEAQPIPSRNGACEVTSSRSSGSSSSNAPTAGAASSRCSKLSNTTSTGPRSRSRLTTRSRDEMERSPSALVAAATAANTSSVETALARLTNHTPPEYASSSSRAATTAMVVLPMPPRPTNVTSRSPSTRNARRSCSSLNLTSNQRRPPRRQIRRPHPFGPRRRKRRSATPIHHRTKQRLGRREILQAMNAQRLDRDNLADQCARRSGQQQLAAVRRRGHPCRPVNLKTHIPSRPTLHIAHMQTHPNRQNADLRRPPVRTQRPQRRHRRPRSSRGIDKRRKKRVTLDPVDKPRLDRDRSTHQIVVNGKHLRPLRPQPSRQLSRPLNVCEQQGNRALRRPAGAFHASSLTPPAGRRESRHRRRPATQDAMTRVIVRSSTDIALRGYVVAELTPSAMPSRCGA